MNDLVFGKPGGELEQIQLGLGHASVQTTERDLGIKQDLVDAPNDGIGVIQGNLQDSVPPTTFMPPALFAAAWIVMSISYTYSGVTKLVSPSWVDGSALARVLNNPLARPTFVRDFVLATPAFALPHRVVGGPHARTHLRPAGALPARASLDLGCHVDAPP